MIASAEHVSQVAIVFLIYLLSANQQKCLVCQMRRRCKLRCVLSDFAGLSNEDSREASNFKHRLLVLVKKRDRKGLAQASTICARPPQG